MSKGKVYSADLRVYATVYVRASSEREARKMIRQKLGDSLEAGGSDDICGLPYAHPELPDVSFSPMMTIVPRQRFTVDVADE